MNSQSQETFRRVTLNDPSLTILCLADNNAEYDGEFYSGSSGNYSALGAAIANNTHLEILEVRSSNGLTLTVTNREFYDGLKRNSSISNLELYCFNRNIAGVGQEILEAYQENSNHLTFLGIANANLQNGGDRVIVVGTLRSCRNLQKVKESPY